VSLLYPVDKDKKRLKRRRFSGEKKIDPHTASILCVGRLGSFLSEGS
jgi:hypothetical protein